MVATRPKIESIEMVIRPDDSPDSSWLEQDGFEDRLTAYRNDEFGFVGIQARAEIFIPYGDGFISESILSPGLWGIEDDSGDDYLKSVYQDELLILRDMLDALNVDTSTGDWFV